MSQNQRTFLSWLRTESFIWTMVDLSGKEYYHHIRRQLAFYIYIHIHTLPYLLWFQLLWWEYQLIVNLSNIIFWIMVCKCIYCLKCSDQTNASIFHHILQSSKATHVWGMNGTLYTIRLVIFWSSLQINRIFMGYL